MLQKAIGNQNFLDSNKSNFTNKQLTSASKSEINTDKIKSRIERAKERRRLFNLVYGGQKIDSFNITKAPEYEKAIKDPKYKTEQNKLEADKKAVVMKTIKSATTGIEFTKAIKQLTTGSKERKAAIKNHLEKTFKISNVGSLKKAFKQRVQAGVLSLDDKQKLENTEYAINEDFPEFSGPPATPRAGRNNKMPRGPPIPGPRGSSVKQGNPTRRPPLNLQEGIEERIGGKSPRLVKRTGITIRQQK